MKTAHFLAALVSAASGGPAFAQAIDKGVAQTPSLDASVPRTESAAAYVAPPAEHLIPALESWLGNLGEKGTYLNLDAITEFAGNVAGGTRQGSTFANQIGFQADIDWQRVAGLTGFSTHLIMVNRSGSSDSHLFGDNLLPVQEIYGAGGDVAFHLVSIYGQETLFDRALDIAAGRMNVENDFASSPLYCNFMNNMLCGDPKALPGGDIGHSAYPDAAWAARIRVRPTPDTYIETGVYEVNQALYSDQGFRSGFDFGAARDSGVYVPVEIAWEPMLGDAHLPGHYKLGFGYDSSHYAGFPDTVSRNGAVASIRHGNTQGWLLLDQMLARNGSGDADGVIALAGFISNDAGNSPYAEQYFAGLIDRGFWPARPKDAAGILFDYSTVSGRLGKAEAAELAFGLPLDNAATGIQTHEMVLEFNYQVHVVNGLTFQPEFQYVFRPNGQSNIPDSVVLGFKAHVVF